MSGYLFYSNKCKSCANLLNIMKGEELLGMFTCKNIDVMEMEEIAQLGLNAVPTILIVSIQGDKQSGEQKRGLYEGQDAFAWIQSVVNNRRSNMIKYTENTKKLIEMNEMKKRMQDGLLGYSNLETNGISDDYAYWSDKTEIDVNLNTAQAKSFLPYDKDPKKFLQQYNQYRVMTIPDVDGDKNAKKNIKGYIINEKDQKKLVGELEKNRDTQLNTIKDNMQRDQINSVINAENRFFQN